LTNRRKERISMRRKGKKDGHTSVRGRRRAKWCALDGGPLGRTSVFFLTRHKSRVYWQQHYLRRQVYHGPSIRRIHWHALSDLSLQHHPTQQGQLVSWPSFPPTLPDQGGDVKGLVSGPNAILSIPSPLFLHSQCANSCDPARHPGLDRRLLHPPAWMDRRQT
jgi:hypothetical protein